MKKFHISAGIVMMLLLMIISCNPFGMSSTKVYVDGTIYFDSTYAIGVEGVAVMTTGTTETILVSTNATGYFEFEIQLYPEASGGSGGGHLGSDGTSGGIITFGVKAINGTKEYIYGGTGGSFTITQGDTLNLYDVNLSMFKDQAGAGGSSVPK